MIDVQESFRQRENWAAISQSDIVGQVTKLVDHARQGGDQVVWIVHHEPGSAGVFDPELGFTRLIDGLVPRAAEPLFSKTSHNAFSTTGLQQYLVTQGITDLQICGIRTEQCCETTARVASDLGYSVEFVVDATATQPIEHWNAPKDRQLQEVLADPLTLDVESIIQRTCYALSGRFATIRTVQEVLAG
ncbi:isochorismatase [Psychromicrobium lacuslunae]|uniref:Isochorismatase n=1 Tax=Psychromicrobium lacuslunae TaxID=1618207 RepID=A0A0D4C3E8_9MICC|nr:isochorismatase [Psychromicrobium lacuslunae]